MKTQTFYYAPDPDDNGSTTTADTGTTSSATTDTGTTATDATTDTNTSAAGTNSGNSTTDTAGTQDTAATSDTSGTETTGTGGGPEDKDSEGFRLLASGSWNAATTVNYQGGQVMHYQIKNTNVLGTTLSINSNLGGNKSIIIAPLQTADMRFDCFGSEPMGWTFDVSTDSDAFIVAWKLYASWLPGDPSNG